MFNGANAQRPHLNELWIDVQTFDIWKLAVTAPAPVVDDANAPPGLARYDIDLGYQGPYLVVHHVAWSYRMRVHSQQAQYTGEYAFRDYTFPRALQPSYFSLAE